MGIEQFPSQCSNKVDEDIIIASCFSMSYLILDFICFIYFAFSTISVISD